MQWIHSACQLMQTFACDRSQHTLQLMLMRNISFKSRHQKNNFLKTLSSKGSLTQLSLWVSIISTKAKFLQFNLREEKHHYFGQAFQIKTGKRISHDSRSGLLHWPRALCRHIQFPWSHLEQFKGHLWLDSSMTQKPRISLLCFHFLPDFGRPARSPKRTLSTYIMYFRGSSALHSQ